MILDYKIFCYKYLNYYTFSTQYVDIITIYKKIKGFIMRLLNDEIGLFNIVSLFIMMTIILLVGVVGEAIKVVFEKIENYELFKQPFGSLLRDFRSHSKPAYY